jgi:hypothetical protein
MPNYKDCIEGSEELWSRALWGWNVESEWREERTVSSSVQMAGPFCCTLALIMPSSGM